MAAKRKYSHQDSTPIEPPPKKYKPTERYIIITFYMFLVKMYTQVMPVEIIK